MTTYFENLTVKLHVPFSQKKKNLHVLYIYQHTCKFHANKILFIIRFINLFFMHDFRL